MNCLNIVLIILTLLCLCSRLANAFFLLYPLYDALVKYLTKDLIEVIIGPGTIALLGGPTTLSSVALTYATPILNIRLLGERFEQFFYNMSGWTIGLLINVLVVIATELFEWFIQILLLFAQAILLVLDGLINKRKRSLSSWGPIDIVSFLASQSKELKKNARFSSKLRGLSSK